MDSKLKFWYIVYFDGSIEGGIVHLETALWLLSLRIKTSGHTNLHLVYKEDGWSITKISNPENYFRMLYKCNEENSI